MHHLHRELLLFELPSQAIACHQAWLKLVGGAQRTHGLLEVLKFWQLPRGGAKMYAGGKK
jgi:hypothetical protein